MIRYDRSIGANVYDPSGGPNEADQGNAMQALARALGFYNEASDLGTAANFGNPQQAAAVLGQLFQGEQAKLDRQNRLNQMAMQQSGQAAIQEARLNQAAQEAAANRDMTRWGKEGDWQRYDRQYAAQRDVAREKALAEMLRQQGIEVGKDRRTQETNESRERAARIGFEGRGQIEKQRELSRLQSVKANLLAKTKPKVTTEERQQLVRAIRSENTARNLGLTPAQIEQKVNEAILAQFEREKARNVQAIDAQMQALQGGGSAGVFGSSMGQSNFQVPDTTEEYDLMGNTEDDSTPSSSLDRSMSQFRQNFPNAGAYYETATNPYASFLKQATGPVSRAMFPRGLEWGQTFGF